MVVKKRDPYLLVQKPLATENILTTEGGDMLNSFNFYGTADNRADKNVHKQAAVSSASNQKNQNQ
jgi:hypothetical protein